MNKQPLSTKLLFYQHTNTYQFFQIFRGRLTFGNVSLYQVTYAAALASN